jgi:hypothetical protein
VLAADINDYGQIVCRSGLAGTVVLTPVWKRGDLTGDCAVALDDLLLVLQNFGAAGDSPPRGDVDLNRVVDLSDLTLLLNKLGYIATNNGTESVDRRPTTLRGGGV